MLVFLVVNLIYWHMKRKLDNWLVISVHNPLCCRENSKLCFICVCTSCRRGNGLVEAFGTTTGTSWRAGCISKALTTFRTRAFYKMYLFWHLTLHSCLYLWKQLQYICSVIINLLVSCLSVWSILWHGHAWEWKLLSGVEKKVLSMSWAR